MIIPAYICDAIRTPFGFCGGILSAIRPDDLGAIPLVALTVRNAGVDWENLDDIIYGCANQAGEANRNIARMSALLAALPQTVPGATLNRLCGSGLDAVACAARAIKSGDAALMIAGGVESMTRAPFALAKVEAAFARRMEIADTACGWPFLNKLLQQEYGFPSLTQSAENTARRFGIGRQAQDDYAFASQARAEAARRNGFLQAEITPVTVPRKGNDPAILTEDEYRHAMPPDRLADLPPLIEGGSVTEGNAAPIADGACALLLACEKMAQKHSLLPKARIIAMANAGVPPCMMGMGPASAARKALVQAGLAMEQIDDIELHESSAAANLAVLRDWGVEDSDPRVNPNGGALALGHPGGASGARLAMATVGRLHSIKGRYALCATDTEGGQGLAMIIERV
jgi:3-oxoadipyl-CoA thiolase